MTDVTVMGAGIFGLSVAWACARRGARVRVIDPHGPGAGASGGIVGALAPHVPENWNDKKAFQLDSLLMAEDFWGEVADAGGGAPGYARLGRIQPVMDDAALSLARAREESAARLWRGAATWRVEPAAAAWGPESPTGHVIRDTLSARIHPRRACEALVAALRARGAEVVRDGAAEGRVVWATGAAGLAELSAAEGRVVWATGAAGLAELSAAHRRQVGTGIKGQAALLEFDARDAPQLFADGIHIVPHADGTTAIGSTTERDYADATTTDGQLDDVIARARAAVPALAAARVIDRWAGLRPRARSRAPMLGPHPMREGEFIANGGFKIGFGMAPMVGTVMADLVLAGRDRIPPGFRPEASF